ncbi:5094_t:CDS:2 [Entrophospora sp. SA101]|nr:5094_t:CDS:2 [Entrophospora sp. SA101]
MKDDGLYGSILKCVKRHAIVDIRSGIGRPHNLKSGVIYVLAVITQGIAACIAHKQASSSEAQNYARMFKPISLIALEIIEKNNLLKSKL